MSPDHAAAMGALGDAVTGAASHDAAGRVHRVEIVQQAPGDWQARCSCRWTSPVLHDRRTTEQSWHEHKRKELSR
jgi:hypothetical protein